MSFWKNLFGGSEWRSMPSSFSTDLRHRLGDDRFNTFTSICRKHNVFDQMSKVINNAGNDEILRNIMLIAFLTSAANEIGRQGVIRQELSFLHDSVQICNVVLELDSNHWPVRICLATVYSCIGDNRGAKREAKQILRVIDDLLNNKDHSSMKLTSIMDDELIEIRNSMSAIAEGNY